MTIKIIQCVVVALIVASVGPVILARDINSVMDDHIVEQCLEDVGVRLIDNGRYICFNETIFPEQFIELNDFSPVERIILSSPGGNVATARIMSRILDERREPVTIAGQCFSACAMVILPGLDNVHIHKSARIAVHGIPMMHYDEWWGWLRGDRSPSRLDRIRAAFGYDMDYAMFSATKQHMEDHLAGQGVDIRYITDVNAQMLQEAKSADCRVELTSYWGVVSAEHLQTYLGERISSLEPIPGSLEDADFALYAHTTEKIGPTTFVFNYDFKNADCSSGH